MNISKNFTVEEMRCPCCKTCDMSHEFMIELQRIRDVLGRPFKINSAYRCEKHNKEIGGAATSRHLTGQAVDISIVGWSGQEIHDLIDEISSQLSSGLGLYRSHLHYDIRAKRAAWTG